MSTIINFRGAKVHNKVELATVIQAGMCKLALPMITYRGFQVHSNVLADWHT